MIDGCVTARCSDFPSEGLPLFCCGADVFRPEVTFSCCQIFLFFASIIEPLFAKKNSTVSLNLLPIALFQVSFHMIVAQQDYCRLSRQ